MFRLELDRTVDRMPDRSAVAVRLLIELFACCDNMPGRAFE